MVFQQFFQQSIFNNVVKQLYIYYLIIIDVLASLTNFSKLYGNYRSAGNLKNFKNKTVGFPSIGKKC